MVSVSLSVSLHPCYQVSLMRIFAEEITTDITREEGWGMGEEGSERMRETEKEHASKRERERARARVKPHIFHACIQHAHSPGNCVLPAIRARNRHSDRVP